MATQDANNNDAESGRERLGQRAQQVMNDRQKETEGQGVGHRASRPFSAEWIKQQLVQPPKGATATSPDAKGSNLSKEVNIHDILADIWSKDRRTEIQRSMHDIIEDYEPRPEKPFRASSPSSDHQERIFARTTPVPLPQTSSDQPRPTHEDSRRGPQHKLLPPSAIVLTKTGSNVKSTDNKKNRMRTPTNKKEGLAKAIVCEGPPVSLKKRTRKGKKKPRPSTLRANRQLHTIPEAHLVRSEGDEEVLGPSDEGPSDEGSSDEGSSDEGSSDEGSSDEGSSDEYEPDLVEPEHVSWVVTSRAEYEKEKAARKSSTLRYCKSPDDESFTRSISISEQAACLPAPKAAILPAPPSCCSPHRHSKQRWEATSPGRENAMMMSRHLSDDSFAKVSVLKVDGDEDSSISVVPDSPSVSLGSSDCGSNGTLPEKEPLPEEVPESPPVPLESKTIQFSIVSDPMGSSRFLWDQQPIVSKRKLSTDDTTISPLATPPVSPPNVAPPSPLVSLESSDCGSNGTPPGKEPLPEEAQFSIVPDPAANPCFLPDQQPIVSKRKLSTDNTTISPLATPPVSPPNVAPLSPVDSEDGYLPLNDEVPSSVHNRHRSLSPSSLPSLSPFSTCGSEATRATKESRDKPRKSVKKKKKSSKTKKAKKACITSLKSSKVADHFVVPELAEKKEKKATSITTLSSSDLVSKVVEKKEKKSRETSITGAVPESKSEKKSEKKEKKPRRASSPEPTTSENSPKKKEKKPRRGIFSFFAPAPASETVTAKKKKKLHRASTETVTAPPEKPQKAVLRTLAPLERTSVKSMDKREKKPRIASVHTTTTVSDTASVKSSEEKENKPRGRSSAGSIKNVEVESSEKKGKSTKSKKERTKSSKSSDPSEKKEKSPEDKGIKKKARSKSAGPIGKSPKLKKTRSKSCDPSGKTQKKRRSKSKTPKSPKKSKKTKKKSSKSKSSYEQLSMSMPEICSTISETDSEPSINLNASTGALSYAPLQVSSDDNDLFYLMSSKKSKNTKKKSSKSKSSDEQLSMSMPEICSTISETDSEPSINLNASTGALSHAPLQVSSNDNDLFYLMSSMLSKPGIIEEEQVEQDSSVNELFYSASSLLSPRSEAVATVKSQPVLSPSGQNILVGQLESTPITYDEEADASAPIEQPNSENQSELFSSAHIFFDKDAVEQQEEAVEQQPQSSERDKAVERRGSIELCGSNLEELELGRQDEGAHSANELFYSAQSLLSACGEEKDIKSQHNFAEEGSQYAACCTSIEEKEAHDLYAGIDMKGVQFLLGHLQVILCLDALMKYPNEDETSSDVLPPVEAKIRARWGLINALGKSEEAKQAQKDFALHYGLLSTDVDELISHLRLCERTGADVRWDLVYQMVFPESEIRWGVFDQIVQSVNYPTTYPDMESVEWSGDSLPPSEDGRRREQADGPTPTTDVPVKDNSLAALFSAAATNPMARVEDEMEAAEASSNPWNYADALLNDTQAQLTFRMEYDVTDEEFASMLRYLSQCKATNTKVEWDKMEQVLCDVPEGVEEGSEVEDGSDSGSDHSSYCSMNDWTAESVAGESYFSVYPEHDDCASELTFGNDDRSVYVEDEMSIGNSSVYPHISEALTEGPKEPDSTTDALQITLSSSFNGTRREPGQTYSSNGPMRGSVRTSSFNGPNRRGPGRTSSFNGPRRGLGPNSSFRGTRRRKDCMLFNRTPPESIYDSGLTVQSTVGRYSIEQSCRATAGSSSVVTIERSRLLRRHQSASAALENLAEALVRRHAAC